jgi:hypothetical protein
LLLLLKAKAKAKAKANILVNNRLNFGSTFARREKGGFGQQFI